MENKIGVGVLGATGIVGQVLVERLVKHPLFEVRLLAASPSSVGKRYFEATKQWVANPIASIPNEIKNQVVENIDPEKISAREDVEIIFSALPTEISREVEPKLAKAGKVVISKSSAFRMEEDIPLLVPEINPSHLKLIDIQKKNRGWKGVLIADPNCSTTALVLALKPLWDSVGLERVIVSTMQASSGAGFMGHSPLVLNQNVIPYIPGEEEKLESEPLKILGELNHSTVKTPDIKISASCTRVDVDVGHTEIVFVETSESCTPEEAARLMREFTGIPQMLNLHCAPKNPVVVLDDINRPQPKYDININGGMSTVVGRIRKDISVRNGLKFVIVGDNIIRGAGGMAILNAELICHREFRKQYNIFASDSLQRIEEIVG